MKQRQEIKCIVWDIDDTLWDGILLEKDDVALKPGIREVIQTLDGRGVLHSIASRNNHDDAIGKLKKFGLDEYFLYPQINWSVKSASIAKIQQNLNIQMDSMMFVDNDPLERDEVKSEHPDILCVDAAEYSALPDLAYLNPKFITEDSGKRRQMYLAGIQRKKDQDSYQGPKRSFLESLNIELQISDAKEGDLERAEELTIRTHQLNTTGMTYSFDRLKQFMVSPEHRLLMCEMKDRYGSYGKIGLAVLETGASFFYLRLLLTSCRVMSLGVGTVLLSHIMRETKKAGRKLRADFRKTKNNRMMYIALTFANFKNIEDKGNGNIVLENDLSVIQAFPPYMDIVLR